MKIKPDAIGFTDKKYLKTSEKLALGGIIVSAIGLIATGVGQILYHKSSTWFMTSNGEQQEYVRGLYNEFDSNAD